VGASGAIAGVMGAYLVLYPYARIVVLLPILFFPFFFEVPAVLFLAFWAFSQVFSGMFALTYAEDVGGIAWWAHAGGFATGMVLQYFFVRNGASYRRPARDETQVEEAWLPYRQGREYQ
jgi:membrane associated rhomboid family serine protease